MATPSIDAYRKHAVWEVLKLKREALETSRFSRRELEAQRIPIIEILAVAEESRRNPQGFTYLPLLDEIAEWANGIVADESGFHTHINRNGPYENLASLVRQLPGAGPRNLPSTYVELLDKSIAAREAELAELLRRTTSLTHDLDGMNQRLAGLANAAEGSATAAERAASSAMQSADRLETELRGEWVNRVEAWELARHEKDDADDAQIAEHLSILANAARLGDRLLEHATATLVAKDWGARASRERRAGWLTRVIGILALGGAAIVGGVIVSRAIEDGFDLTVGDGLLRASLVLAIAGIGAALLAESRRHFREADTSEEIALALTAVEPFYAGDAAQREAARKALGEAVFVRNVLSRFSHRDAAKHGGGVAEASVSSVVDDITKGLDAVTKAANAK